MPRSTARQHPASEFPPVTLISEFYRQEFLKHQQFLQLQREYFSEHAVACAEAALCRILSQLDALCSRRNAEQLVSRLLRSLDVVTGVSALSDPKKAN